MPERILSVSEINNFIKRLLENNSILKRVIVEGEITNLKRASSGHYYFSLKDDRSEIRCIMWRSRVEQSRFRPEDGLAVKVRGAVEVYSQRGSYSIIVSSIKPAGIGTLFELYQKRIDDYSRAGYFNQEHKKPLPENISTVGVVTSETGAVIHDILTTITRRNPLLKVILVPAVVQGEGAAASIASGITQLNNEGSADVIIVGRGGGSLEDLWAFNEEEVMQAIYDSEIPVISAVGHETDVTISDLTADLRAPTPTAAAEFVSDGLIQLEDKLLSLEQRMTRALVARYNALNSKIEVLKLRLLKSSPERILREKQYRVDELETRLINTETRIIDSYRNRIENLKTQLKLLNPKELFKRGYTMVTGMDGRVIRSAKTALEKKDVRLHFDDGEVLAKVISDEQG